MGVVSALLPWMLAAMRVMNVALTWLMTYAIHSTLLIGGVWIYLATPAGKRLSATGASWLWRFALVGGIASASLQALRSPDPLAGTVRVGTGAPARTVVRVSVDRSMVPARPGIVAGPPSRWLEWRGEPTPAIGVIRTTVDTQPRWIPVLLAAWLIGAVALAGLYLRARRRFFRMLGDRRNGEFTLAGGALRAVRERAGVRRPIRLTVSDPLTSPVALGSSEICIPRRALAELDPIRMESILAHELAHLERGDPAWLTIGRLVEVILFFQPLNRIARLRMQEAAEFASDTWAAGIVSRPLDLAHCLARVAEWTIGSSRLLAPAMAERRGTVLVRRVQRLTGDIPCRVEGNGRGLRLASAIAVVGLVLLAPRAVVGRPASATGTLDGVLRLRLDSVAAGGLRSLSAEHDVRIVRFSPAP